MPSRRALLGTVAGAAAALAGCSGSTREPNGESPATGTPMPTATDEPASTPAPIGATLEVGDSEVTVSETAVQSSVVHLDSPDSMDVETADGRFVLIRVDASDPAPSPVDYVLKAGGEVYRRVVPGSSWDFRVDGELRRGYRHDGDAEGWLAFEGPHLASAPETRIECQDAVWRLPDTVGDALARPTPEWELRSFAVPDELHPGEAFEARIGFENAGDVDATFRGALNVSNLNYAYIPYPFAVEVAAGERRTWSKTLSVPVDIGEGRPVFYLRTPAGSGRREAEVVTGTATPE